MKNKGKVTLILVCTLCLIIFGFAKVIDQINMNKTLNEDEIAKVEKNLAIISGTLTKSSSPYTQIEAHEKEAKEIIDMGYPAVNYFIEKYKSGNLDAGNAWVIAWICNEILGNKNPIKIWQLDNKNGWSSGEEWFEKYTGK